MTEWSGVKIASPYDDTPDAQQATKEELNHVIYTQNIPQNVADPVFNPNMAYAEISLDLNENDKVLLNAIKKSINNGWVGWRSWVNDATTIGMEAEQLIREMKKKNVKASDLLFDHEFNKYLWGKTWKDMLKDMVVSKDIIEYLKENLL